MIRIDITLSSDFPIVLPVHYNEHIQALVYHHLDPDVARKLHDEGFRYGKRRFKLFTFSRIFGRGRYDRKNRLLTFPPRIRIAFAFAVESIGRSFLDRMVRSDPIVLEGNLLKVAETRITIPKVGRKVKVKTLSPITVYRTVPEGGRRRTVYFPPDSPEFAGLVKMNLLRKYETLYGREYSGGLEVHTLQKGRMAIVKYKGTVIKAWDGTFLLRGEPDILRLALGAGLGAKNSHGFGMVTEIT